jgi:hypothetical protein
MCIIIFKPENKVMKQEHFDNSQKINSDGYGYSFIIGEGDTASITTRKFMKYSKFLKAYRKDEEQHNATTPFLIHFRACSKGVVDVANAHPFVINEGQVFAHNGTIWGLPDDKTKSDTRLFNELVLRKLPYRWEYSEGIQRLIQHWLGDKNRVVVLNKDKKFLIFNEKEGKWDDGIWYSNEHYTGDFVRHGAGAAVRYAEWLTKVNAVQQASASRFNSEYWDTFDESYTWDYETNSWREKKTGKHEHIYPVVEGNKPKQQSLPTTTMVGVKKETNKSDSCDFCGLSLNDKKDVYNLTFGDYYELCSYCAETLTEMGAVEYAN